MVLALACVPATLHAQETQDNARRGGFWIGFGLGGGVNTASVSTNENRGGVAGYVRAGGAPSGHVVLGTELIGWATEANNVTTSRGNANVFVQYYPSTTGGLFFKGGLGGAGIAVSRSVTSGTLVNDTQGFGLTLGGGYEFRLSRIASFATNLDWVFQAFDNPVPGNADTSSLFLLTIGITFPRIK
jgi:hypothetical protein